MNFRLPRGSSFYNYAFICPRVHIAVDGALAFFVGYIDLSFIRKSFYFES
jgi:hypothetical protein